MFQPARLLSVFLAALGVAAGARAQPSNNSCAGAPTLSFPATVTGTNVAATSDLPASSCAFTATDSKDVWYRFAAPVAGLYEFNTLGAGTLADTTLSAWTDCPTAGVEIACNDDIGGGNLRSRMLVNLVAAEIVYIRVAGWNHQTGTFTLSLLAGPPPVANDLCVNATLVLPPASISGTNVNASGSNLTTCASGDNNDVWFRLTTPFNGQYTINTIGPGTLTDTTLALFDSCAGPQLDCNDDAWTGEFRSSITRTLDGGRSYWIRVSGFAGEVGTFTLNIPDPIPSSTLPNDACTTAAPIAALPYSDTLTDLALATDDPANASCDNADLVFIRRGAWYSYFSQTAQAVRIREIGGLPTVLALFTAAGGVCNTSMPEVACSTAGDMVVALAPQTHYLLAVGLDILGQVPSPSLINLSIESVPPPANDTCAAAPWLVLGSSIVGTNAGASSDISSTSCAFAASDPIDVWYKFRPTTTGVYLFDTRGSVGLADTTLSIWSACPAAGVELFCNDDFAGQCAAVLNVRLTANTTYYIRVAGHASAMGPFSLALLPGIVVSHDTCGLARPILRQFVGDVDTTFANSEAAEPSGSCDGAGTTGVSRSVWLSFVPGSEGQITGSIDATAYDQIVVVYVGVCGLLTEVACLDAEPADLSSIPVLAGQTHYIAIGAFEGEPGGVSSIDITVPDSTPESGACCRGSACLITTLDACAGNATIFAGPGTACQLVASNPGPCCRADFNHSGGVTVQDIFDFLGAYFGGSFLADTNGGGLSVQDIFDFLAAYFTGC